MVGWGEGGLPAPAVSHRCVVRSVRSSPSNPHLLPPPVMWANIPANHIPVAPIVLAFSSLGSCVLSIGSQVDSLSRPFFAKMSLPLGGGGGVRREDAVRFLDRVQQRLASRPQDYADFLNIMKVGRILNWTLILSPWPHDAISFRSCKQKTSQWKVQLKRSKIYSRC